MGLGSITAMATLSSQARVLLLMMLGLMYLHGGALAAPMHLAPGADPELGGIASGNESVADNSVIDSNITFVKETLVHVQVSPPYTLDLADFAAVHQSTASIQSFLESGGSLFDSVVRFFRESMTVFSPPSQAQASPTTTTTKPPTERLRRRFAV